MWYICPRKCGTLFPRPPGGRPETHADRSPAALMERKAIIRDLTTGSVPRTLLSFSLPLFLSGLLQMVYNMVDMIVVGRFVGTDGLSAVSIGGEVLMLITFVSMGFSNAGQILISRFVGGNRRDCSYIR